MSIIPAKRVDQNILAILLCIASFLFYLSFLDTYHDWGDDFAQYMIHAQNILSGKDYADTGYIFNPENAIIGPAVYPPVFPLLLCIPIGLFGTNLFLIKGFIAFLFSLSLFIIYKIVKNEGGEKYALWMIPIFGLNPFILKFLQEIMSDLPFILFVSLTFLFLQKAKSEIKHVNGIAILAGLFAGIAAGTRVTGHLIVAVLIIHLLQIRKFNLKISLLPMIIFLITSTSLYFLFPGVGSGYPILFDLNSLFTNIQDLLRSYFSFFGKGYFYAGWVLAIFTILFIPYGMWNMRTGGLHYLAFIFLYVGLMIMWGAKGHGLRLLLPVFPFLMMFFLKGISDISLKFRFEPSLISSLLSLIIILNYYPAISAGYHQKSEPGPYDTEAQKMFEAVHNIIPEGETVAFIKPRTMAYYGARPGIGLDKTESLQVLLDSMKNRGIKYFVSSPFDNERIKADCRSEQMAKTAIWETREYKIFKLN